MNSYSSFSKLNTIVDIGDYYNRHNIYQIAKKSLNKIGKNECLSPMNYISKNHVEYSVGKNRLVLKHRIGSNSRYGVIYLTTSKDNHKFATKLTPVDTYNYNEILIAKKLSNIAIRDKSPHFLIVYKVMSCNNDLSLSSELLPKIIKNDNYFISVNELVSGNFKNFLLDFNVSPQLLLNAIQQILIAVLSFHHFTGGLFHDDCHYKNFLFHKIKPGGYFHYNIYGRDIYIKNLGYIWMIWDFGLVKRDSYSIKRRLEDYFRILYSVDKYYKQPLANVDRIFELRRNYIDIFGNSDKMFFEVLFNFKGLFEFDIPKNSKIINKKPYIIK